MPTPGGTRSGQSLSQVFKYPYQKPPKPAVFVTRVPRLSRKKHLTISFAYQVTKHTLLTYHTNVVFVKEIIEELSAMRQTMKIIGHAPNNEDSGSNEETSARIGLAKEMLIVAGRRSGASVKALSEIPGLNASNISRRHDASVTRMRENEAVREMAEQVGQESQYRRPDVMKLIPPESSVRKHSEF
jgi:hypothetical protein